MRISDCSSDVCSSDLKAKEVAAALLLSKEEFGSPIRIDPHASVAYFAEADKKPKGRLAVDREIERLAAALGQLPGQFAAILRNVRPAAETPLGLYAAVQQLGAEDLDLLLCLLVLVAFGNRDMAASEPAVSLFNRGAQDIGCTRQKGGEAEA